MSAVDDMREWFRSVGLAYRSPADLVRSSDFRRFTVDARNGLELIALALDEIAPYEGDPAHPVRFGSVVDALKSGRYAFDSEERQLDAALETLLAV
ncbi:MAG: hypothetical protein ITG02_02370, partial [Patulibacter sp.]|nr:hypothetical protein [Patulibacter sp.]